MISVYIFQFKFKSNKRVLKISSIAMVISVLILLFSINKFTIIIYNLCKSVFLVLLINTAETKRYAIINEDKRFIEEYLVEHQVTSEVFLNISRITGYLVLFVASLFNNMLLFKILLFIVTIVMLVYSKLMISLDKENIIRN